MTLDTVMLSVTNEPIIISVVMLNVIILNAVAPSKGAPPGKAIMALPANIRLGWK